jgi:hypothetical protein
MKFIDPALPDKEIVKRLDELSELIENLGSRNDEERSEMRYVV